MSAEQWEVLELLGQAAVYVLQDGEHVPVYALVMRPGGQIEMIDLERGYARQGEAMAVIYARLIPMAEKGEIIASGIVYQHGDAGKEKLPMLAFELEHAGHPRFFIGAPYERTANGVSVGQLIGTVEEPRLFKR